MGDVVARSSEPTLAAIKLAWWRERLEELDQERVPAEPRLRAAATELLPRGISGTELAALESGWAALLEQEPDPNLALGGGETLFRLAARLFTPNPPAMVETAGGIYSAGHLVRLGLAPNGSFVTPETSRIPRMFRPLTGLAALAARDLRRESTLFEAEATPARAWALLRHRLTGRLDRS